MLLPLRNLRQRQQADCLVACAAMVLDYLGIDTTYEWLLRLLGTAEPGTPFSNLERLRTLNLFVRCEYYGTIRHHQPNRTRLMMASTGNTRSSTFIKR